MTLRVFAIALLALALAGCGEKPQTAGAKKSDGKPWEGVVGSDATNTVGGWKAGDQKAWEEQMRSRAQGQNEYARSAAVPGAKP